MREGLYSVAQAAVPTLYDAPFDMFASSVVFGRLSGGGPSLERTGLSSVSLFYRERTGKNFNFGPHWRDLGEFFSDSQSINSLLQAGSLFFD
jgi:hypothetical protein